ncbi:MAG: patatin-like phospholipase family protein, partial [Bacteroidota bacterium]
FVRFAQYHRDLAGGFTPEVMNKMLGLALGIVLVFLLAATYFFARRGIFNWSGRKIEAGMAQHRGAQNSKVILERAKESFRYLQRADSYLLFPWIVIKVDKSDQTPFRDVVRILNQHHGKLLLLQLLTLGLIAVLGLMEGNRYFQIPAGASFLLISALGVMSLGFVAFWFRKTGAFTVVAFVAFLFVYNQFDWFREQNHALGLDYHVAPAAYSFENLQSLTTDSIYKSDRVATLASLEAWKQNYQQKYGPFAQPRLVLVTASGGGLRSAFWTFQIMQELDQLSKGRLMDETRLMTGASGGMFGLTYFRELYWRQQQGDSIDLQSKQYQDNVSKDLLNRVFFKIFSDIILPTQSVDVAGHRYHRETGYSFDHQLALNLPELADRRLGDYRQAEASGELPYLILSPTVINQGRQLYVSASPVSYLARPSQLSEGLFSRSRGVEFRRLFAQHQADSLLITTALRMNASFPVILPIVELPSEPLMEVMDAGAIDNYGTQTAVKFLVEFKDWLQENTAGVLLLQIRDNDRLDPIRQPYHHTLSRLVTTIDGGYYSMAQAKDLNNDYLLEFLRKWYPQNSLEVLTIEYPKEATNTHVSLSLHLTGREKQRLKQGIYVKQNDPAFAALREWYQPEWLANQNR